MAAAEVGPIWMERAEEATPTNRMGRRRRDAVGNPPTNPKRTTASSSCMQVIDQSHCFSSIAFHKMEHRQKDDRVQKYLIYAKLNQLLATLVEAATLFMNISLDFINKAKALLTRKGKLRVWFHIHGSENSPSGICLGHDHRRQAS
ncbi:hypothetical protein T07_5299 [Trichinella nelsoni]|uniref:Uncharacterized protein n=1 Tax=Trichinella nelsoni TaxID=6336 RepID=A0A0V0SMU8_9BILA|nr:hypothetical protein T07_5299 [Trichinella nelsoni]